MDVGSIQSTSRLTTTQLDPTTSATSNQLDDLRNQLALERSIAVGAENLLHVFETDTEGTEELRNQVEEELQAANARIAHLVSLLTEAEGEEPADPLELPQPLPSTLPSRVASPHIEQSPVPPSSLPNGDSFGPTFELVLTLLHRLDELQDAVEKIRSMDTIVAAVNRQLRIKYELKLEDVLPSIMGCLGDDAGKDVRASAYRLLRHLIVDQHDVNQLQTRCFDLFLVRSLSRDHKFEVEKEQALRLVRLLLSLPDADRPVPPSVIRAIVAIAENTEEKLRLASLETLGELLIRDIALLVSAEGLRVVLQVLSDGPHDLSPFLAMGFLGVMDKPDTRQFLRPGVDIEIVLAGFTETQSKGSSQEERVRASAKIITHFLQSWSGLMYLSLNGRQALVSLVDSLKSPSKTVRESLLDTFINIFNVKTPAWYSSFLSGNRLTYYNPQPSGKLLSGFNSAPTSDKTNLIDQYLAVLLLVFIDAGLLEALVAVATGPKDASSARKVALLIGEILQLSNRVLPLSYATRVQALPGLFSLASSFDTSDARLAATSTLSAVDSLHRNRERLQSAPSEDARPRANSIDDPLARGQRQVETAKIRMGMQIDDAHFRNLLLETQVLNTKDHTRWAFEILTELLEGPLLAPKRLDEAMRASKFMRRLLSFFHPFSYRYSDTKRSANTIKYTKLGCTIITTLLASPDGVRYLAEDQLLRQIADCLVQLDPLNASPASEVLFSKHRLETTLASGYFEMLGILTKSPEGVRLLDQFKIFTSFYRISELRSREDLIKAIIENADYTLDGHMRVFLSKALTSSYKHVRIFATQHLAKLSREVVVTQEWQIRLLLTQLYDPSTEVCELSVRVLEEACRSLETLELVVQMRPSLDHLGDVGTVLLTRFLSTSIGVRYLHEIEFIERELEDWFNERNLTYVVQLELQLASAFAGDSSTYGSSGSFDGAAPPHFYGELVKTDEGCDMLEESGHFPEFADFIRQHGLEDFDADIIDKLKSVLWAVGHVGASSGGLPFLEEEYIVQSIVEIAEDSPVYSLRGTACFALGLISSTLEGAEILEELGWETVCTPLGGSRGLCVPIRIGSFIDTPLWEPPPLEIPEALLLASPSNHLEVETLAAFANLSNHILASKASKTLARLKGRHRDLFSSSSLCYRALEMLANHHYRLAVRRYIIELFDVALDDRTALEIMNAGEELKARHLEEETTVKLPVKMAAVDAILEGIEGEFTDDDESSLEEGATVMPLQILAPLLTIRGFIL